jgi:hypothetical protein
MKFEFLNPEWLACFYGVIWERVRLLSVQYPDLSYSCCEVFTNAPPHITSSPDRKIGWYVFVSGSEFTFGLGDRDDVEFKCIFDYQAAIPMAKYAIDGDPERAAYIAKRVEELDAVGKGKIINKRSPGPVLFGSLHDVMARITL